MTQASGALMQGLLDELVSEELNLGAVAHDLALTRNKWEVAGRKYAAVRDMVITQLGKSPYVLEGTEWPRGHGFDHPYVRGAFRFLHMNVGDAVVLALQESEQPLTLDQLVEKLKDGRGYPVPRAVNAALMQKAGVKKDEEAGTYTYVPVATEAKSADDLPF